jgi:hypothetical protein
LNRFLFANGRMGPDRGEVFLEVGGNLFPWRPIMKKLSVLAIVVWRRVIGGGAFLVSVVA